MPQVREYSPHRASRGLSRNRVRYRIDEDPTLTAYGTTDDFIVLSAVIGLVIGAFLTWLGWRGRQIWLTVWCGGLVIASIACLIWL